MNSKKRLMFSILHIDCRIAYDEDSLPYRESGLFGLHHNKEFEMWQCPKLQDTHHRIFIFMTRHCLFTGVIFCSSMPS